MLRVPIEVWKIGALIVAAILAVAMTCIAFSGCAPRDKSTDQKGVLGRDEAGFRLVLILDSDAIRQTDSWSFVCYCADQYFRSKIGDPADDIIICGIMDNGRSLLWQGSPRHLREQFPTKESFQSFMEGKLGSVSTFKRDVHRGISQALRYVSSMQTVKSGQTKVATLVLSDMIDISPNSKETEEALLKDFSTYLEAGGELGIYWIDQDRYFAWRENFKRAGHDLVIVEPDIHGRPPLPNFDR